MQNLVCAKQMLMCVFCRILHNTFLAMAAQVREALWLCDVRVYM